MPGQTPVKCEPVRGSDPAVRLVTLDPGHFHAGLVQKYMSAQISPVVQVYAPEGPDLREHLQRIQGFNARPENPTRWQEKVCAGADFLKRMLHEKAGNLVVISGNNQRKTEYISRSVKAGFNVLADKPMAITPAGFELLCKAFENAATRKVLLYDIMTERFEITTVLQRKLAQIPEIFGALERGSIAEPAVVMESVHHFLKEVAGKPLIRPAWFFDEHQQGEAIQDVGTHLVDLVQWICFPEQSLDWRKDVAVHKARRWVTPLTLDQFKRVTGLDSYPEFLLRSVVPNGTLEVFQNGEVDYSLRGIHARVAALWRAEAPPGGGDTHYSLLRGSRANIVIEQGPEHGYLPTLLIENKGGRSAEFETTLRTCVARLCASWPGLQLKPAGGAWEIVVPEKYRIGHEAHFAQVTENYLRYLTRGKLPEWEVPNMLAKYYTTTEAYRLSHGDG